MMDWIMIREPFFRTAEEAEQYVTRELPPAVPEGWRIERSSGERLTWIVARTPTNSRGGWENYRVEVSRGLEDVYKRQAWLRTGSPAPNPASAHPRREPQCGGTNP